MYKCCTREDYTVKETRAPSIHSSLRFQEILLYQKPADFGVVDTGGKFATGINNTSETGGKMAAGVVDTGGKFAVGDVDTAGNFAASVIDTCGKFATGVVDTGGAP